MFSQHLARLRDRHPWDLMTGVVGDGGLGSERRAPLPIYVVDDDLSVRESLSVLLETLGFEALPYSSGSELLADERRGDAGCLIVDQHMPGMDGLETLAALRREGLATPAILITGRLDPAIAARAASLGVIGVLEKPFQTTRLIELVDASLDRSR